jgi:isopenicillin N synthase-like dioxygenase
MSFKNHGADESVDGMFEMGSEIMALPMEEKMEFEQGDDGVSFGYSRKTFIMPSPNDLYLFCRYKATGANAVDATGELDTVEFLNVAKDDALAWPKQARRAYPRTVNDRMASTIVPFVRQSLEVNNTILEIFNDKLGLPAGSLLERHLMEEFSGSEARITKNGPTTNTTKLAIGSHTDFGSLVINCSFTHIFSPVAYHYGFTLVIPSQPIGRAPGAPSRF